MDYDKYREEYLKHHTWIKKTICEIQEKHPSLTEVKIKRLLTDHTMSEILWWTFVKWHFVPKDLFREPTKLYLTNSICNEQEHKSR